MEEDVAGSICQALPSQPGRRARALSPGAWHGAGGMWASAVSGRARQWFARLGVVMDSVGGGGQHRGGTLEEEVDTG